MKIINKILMVFVLSLAFSIAASAAPHSVTLGWTKSVDDTGASGQGYTIWRQSGTCPASVTTTAGFTALNASLVTGITFTDSTVVPGTYCYIGTFTEAGATSLPSNTAGAVILPLAPTNVTVTGSN